MCVHTVRCRYIQHSGNGPNNTNANIFFGTMNEANHRDLHNDNPFTVFFGSSFSRSLSLSLSLSLSRARARSPSLALSPSRSLSLSLSVPLALSPSRSLSLSLSLPLAPRSTLPAYVSFHNHIAQLLHWQSQTTEKFAHCPSVSRRECSWGPPRRLCSPARML